MNESIKHQPRQIYWRMIGLLAVLNVLIPRIDWGVDALWATYAGVLISQWNWLATWAVFGPTPWKERALEVLGGSFALLLSLLIGSSPHNWLEPSDLGKAICLLPVAMLAGQSPLWLLRVILGWRIRPQQQPAETLADDARRYELRHLFAGTAVVAASLGAARGAGAPTETLLSVLIAPPLVSLITAAPCICTGIVLGDSWEANMILTVYILLFPAIALAAASVSPGPGPPGDFIFGFCGFMCGTAVVVHTGLRQIRASGFVISTRRGRRRGQC